MESTKINPIIKNVNEDESFFLYGLSLVEESDMEIQRIIYENILESHSNISSIHETNIIDLAERIIHWFVEQIKKLFGKFKAYVLRIVNSGEYIKNNKDRILAYTGTFDVDFERYFFTCTNPDIPKCDLVEQLGKELDQLQAQLDSLRGLKSKEERLEVMNRIYQSMKDIDDSEMYYGRIRSFCIAATYPIAEDEYAKELFNVFRNGGDYYTAKVSSVEIAEVYERYSKVKQTIKDVEKSKRDIIKSADTLLKDLKKISLKDVSNNYSPYDIGEEEMFDRIRKCKVAQLQKICNIYTLAFSAKIDALKDSMSQDKKLLYEVITHLEVGE